MTPSTLTYLAGYFDGRGCICCRSRQRYTVRGQDRYRADFHVSLGTSSQRELLEGLHRAYGGFVTTSRPKHQRPVHVWRAVWHHAARFLRDIRPHVRLRGAEIDLALEFFATIQAHGGRSIDAVATRRRLAIEKQLAGLKKRRPRTSGYGPVSATVAAAL